MSCILKAANFTSNPSDDVAQVCAHNINVAYNSRRTALSVSLLVKILCTFTNTMILKLLGHSMML